MEAITSAVKFDQALWDARSAGNRSEDSDQNPHMYSSSLWAAWEAGRAFGLGRISQARGHAMNVQMDHGTYRIGFDELQHALRRVMHISYLR